MARNGKEIRIPQFFKEIVEQVAFEARKSEFVDQKSGVSARLPISAMENLISNAERRAIITGDPVVIPRLCDLPHVLPGLTGKIELVFEGEQEGSVKVSRALVGKAVRETFKRYFPDPLRKPPRQKQEQSGNRGAEDVEYSKILAWFEGGNVVEVADDMPGPAYKRELEKCAASASLSNDRCRISNRSLNSRLSWNLCWTVCIRIRKLQRMKSTT